MAVLLTGNGPIPSQVTLLNYLQGFGAQYIDTGVLPNSNTTIEVKYNSVDTSITLGCIVGSDNGWCSSGCAILLNTVEFGSNAYSMNTATAADTTVKLDKGTLYKNGTQVNATSQSFTSSIPLTAFCLNRKGSKEEYFSGKIYYIKIYDNGTLIRDFVPCIDKEGAACFFDKVSGECYYNAGSGEFTAG